eukprot:721625-Prymnesium_polylepis.1
MGQYAARASDTATARKGRRSAQATRAGGRRRQLVQRHGRPNLIYRATATDRRRVSIASASARQRSV